MNAPHQEDVNLIAKVLELRSPALALLAGLEGVQVKVLPSLTFDAFTTKRSDYRYEVTLSAGIWIALHHLMTQDPSNYESEPDSLTTSVRTIASFTDNGRVRIADVEQIVRQGEHWQWHSIADESDHELYGNFIQTYINPWVEGGRIDQRIELAAAFIALHEFWHICQDHFRRFENKDRLHNKRIELLADLNATCVFPDLISQNSKSFGISDTKRCNQIIAAGFSIGCALLCFQTLHRLGRHQGEHPTPFSRLSVLLLLLANNAVNREISVSDRGYLVTGMHLLLKSFERVGGSTSQDAIDTWEAAQGIPKLEKYLIANPSPFAMQIGNQVSNPS
jgi:hypothetical protein